MRLFRSVVVLFGLVPAIGGCTDAGGSDPEVTRTAGLTAVTGRPVAGRSRRTSSRTLNPSQTNIRRKPIGQNQSVDVAIPFDRPAHPVQAAAVSVDATAATPGTVVPELPVGAGPQLPAARVGVAVACTSVSTLKLACPSDAPVPSTCTAADHLPAGCHAMTTPGALYPDNAVPACCS